jgi:putative SOS response-associated peptidase YedK
MNVGFANINAKAEGIENRPAFREAFERRRCLVPVDNSFEWKKTATGKQPYAIALADRRLMALAGLWENWRSPAGEWVRSFAIIATTPNELCARFTTACQWSSRKKAGRFGWARSRRIHPRSRPCLRRFPRKR